MNSRFWILTALIVTVALCRYFLISIPNAAPIAAIALFGGAYFADRKYALIVPLLALLLSDIMMEITFQLGMQPFPGFYSTMMLVVYTTIALIVGVGLLLKNRRKPLFIGLSAIFAGLLFFLGDKFRGMGVWRRKFLSTEFRRSYDLLRGGYSFLKKHPH